ncbi:polysaccharide deacetylase family protein [Emcibacter sp. SYSU 3D8]|uniref:polysaccharide deacetylase family protein n=1 Tax=Emcibacter sp. SYSU 3D8 TaxID=3133969 RepID=UPI0031FF3E70
MTRILTRLISVAAFAAILAGCATEQVRIEAPRDKVVARSDDFMLVRAGGGDTLRTLAKTYLNDEDKSGAIAEVNETQSLTPGQIVIIPLRAGKAWTVDADGYQVVPILCYHQFGAGKRARNKMEVSENAFEQQMAYLKDNGYSVINLADLHAFLNGDKALAEKSVVITIDDGYRSTYDVAFPILKKYGFPATVYVYSDFIGAGMSLTWAQMNEMEASGLIDIESHSKTHTSMALLPNEANGAAYGDRVAQEIVVPDGVLSAKLGKPITHFAYPYGDTSPTALSILKERGYATATTVQRGGNPSFADPLILRRDMVYSDDKLSDFKKYVAVRVDMKLR